MTDLTKNIWVIGAVAGVATVLLYVSSILAPGGVFVGLFVPLPSLIAGIAYGWPVAGIAGLVGALCFFFIAGGSGIAGMVYAIMIAVPATLLSQVMGMWRADETQRYTDSFRNPPPSDAMDQVEWFPLSGILAWLVILATVLTALMLLSLGVGDVAYTSNVHELVDHLITQLRPAMKSELTLDQVAALKVNTAALLPAFVAASWVMLMVLNGWFAARIARMSGLLQRPAPDMRMAMLPRLVLFGLGVALVIATFGGVPGRIATAFSGAALFAIMMIGLAVLHEWSVGRPARAMLLGGVYFGAIVAQPFSGLLLILLGFADWFFHLRIKARLRRTGQASGSGPPNEPPET